MSILLNLKSFLVLGVILVGVTSLTWIMYTITSGVAAKVELEYTAASLAENVKIKRSAERTLQILIN